MAKTKLLLLAFLTGLSSFGQIANRYDVVITEIMADPSPVVSLPNAEFIEIKNVSTNSFNLNGWRLSDASATATITTAFVLQPEVPVIIIFYFINYITIQMDQYGIALIVRKRR